MAQLYFGLPAAARLIIQAAAVVACAAIGSFLVGAFRPTIPLGIIWVFLIPALVAIVGNKGNTNRLVAAIGWMVAAFFTTLLLVIPAGLGPS